MATQTIPQATYQVGTRNLGPFNVPNGATNVTLTFDRSQWTDPAVKLTARFELSLDNGATWSPNPAGQPTWPWGSFPVTITSEGGVIGVPSTQQSIALPDPTNTQRKVRAVVTVAGGPLTTTITVDVT